MLVVIGAGLLGSPAAQGQIVQQKPAQVKAANRRALRETRNTDLPYKESHLALTPNRLKRGESVQPRAETSRELDYKTGTSPNVRPVGLLGRRKKNL
jgi:hypothetical protein